MRRSGLAAVLTLVAVLAALTATTSAVSSTSAESVTPTAAPKAVRGSLSVTPSVYVPGQAMRFTGSIGGSGKRTVILQSHMNRPGDVWVGVADATFKTNGQGDFDFTYPAPSMFGIRFRVAGGGLVTKPYLFKARPQEITLALQGSSPDIPFYTVPATGQLTVVADATPSVRAALGTPPAFDGRTVLLQERVDVNQWRTIARGTSDSEGHTTFVVTAPDQGARVLRARQERVTSKKNQIGWYASFPAYFAVGATDEPLPSDAARAPSGPAAVPSAATSARRATASQQYGWGASLFDFDWERGEDLDSPASRGTRPKGRWLDTSDGTGRAVPFNGGLVLQSKLKHVGEGDLGTTTVTLRGNSQKRGRWEFRLQGHVWESGARPFRFLLELVPSGAPLVACSPSSVVVADVVMGTPGLTVGVRRRAANAVWSRRHDDVRLAETPFNMAVEVGKKHITWFRDGRPLATVKGREAQLGVRLVPRLSLIGHQEEMNGAQVDSDWQRAWDLDRGEQVKSAPALSRAAYSDSC